MPPTDSTRAARARARRILLAHLAAVGTLPCPRCGGPMRPGDALDVGHETDVARGGAGSAMRLEHRSCNRGAGKRLALQLARERRASRADDVERDRELERRNMIDERERDRQRRQRRVIVAPDPGDEAVRRA